MTMLVAVGNDHRLWINFSLNHLLERARARSQSSILLSANKAKGLKRKMKMEWLLNLRKKWQRSGEAWSKRHGRLRIRHSHHPLTCYRLHHRLVHHHHLRVLPRGEKGRRVRSGNKEKYWKICRVGRDLQVSDGPHYPRDAHVWWAVR